MTCRVYTKNKMLIMAFSGDIANWPSKSNDGQIAYTRGRPRIVHTKDFNKRMAEIKAYYRAAISKLNKPPAFGEQKMMCLCLLSVKSRMLDSHNFCKTFGDFCEEVGLIDNDRYLTIWPVHKKDCGIIADSADTTHIIIRPLIDFNFDDFIKDFTT